MNRTEGLKTSLPLGITIGERFDGRGKPFFVRYGRPRKTESFADETARNDKAENLAEEKAEQGSSVLNFDPKEWLEFQQWRKTRKVVPLVNQAVTDYLAFRLKEGLNAKSDAYLHMNLHLQRFVAHFDGRPLDQITTEEILAWIEGLKDPETNLPMGKITRRGHRNHVNLFFKRALMVEWIARNPCHAVILPRIKSKTKEAMPPEKIFALLKANRDEPVIGRIALELFGGLRYSSAGRLVKSQLNFEENGINLPGEEHKSGKDLYREGHPDVLWAWLKHAPEGSFVKRSVSNYGHQKAMAYVLASQGGVKIIPPRNGFRESFCCYLLAIMKDYKTVGYYMQHTQISTTMLYEGKATKRDAELVMKMTPEAVLLTWEKFLSMNQKPK